MSCLIIGLWFRQKRKRSDPQTPNPKQICSKRSWDGQIRKWRRLLHVYDPPIEEGEEMAEDFSHIHLKSNNTAENDNERYGLGKLNDFSFLLLILVSLVCSCLQTPTF